MMPDTAALAVTLAERLPALQRTCEKNWRGYGLYPPKANWDQSTRDRALREQPEHDAGQCDCAGRGWVPVTELDAVLNVLDNEGYVTIILRHRRVSWIAELWHYDAMSNAKHFFGEGPTRLDALLRAACAATEPKEAHGG